MNKINAIVKELVRADKISLPEGIAIVQVMEQSKPVDGTVIEEARLALVKEPT